MPADARGRLNDLRDGLLRLHTSLLASERAAYELDVARIESPAQFFNLVMNDPWFSWLREVSQFIVQIDVLLDEKEPKAPPDADGLIAQARALISPAEEGEPFARRYFEAMQRDPGAVLAHRDMMRVFAALER